ncbi:MAG: right-handed parallel beta-helix repeat-containing protein [Solirubrobacteraceae bacterium]
MPARLTIAALLALLMLVLPETAPAAVTCDRYAGGFGSDSAPGTLTQPYRTAQRLANSLTAGQTGCLSTGTYTDELAGPYVLNVLRGGAPGAPVTIRSAPGQRATLRGIVMVPLGSNHVTISNVDIDGRRLTLDESTGIKINAEDTILEDNTITNHSRTICMGLGYPGWGEAIRTVIRRNTFQDCGRVGNKFEHSAYIEWTRGVLVTDNIFLRSGAYAVQLYPDAQGTTVSHNVMVGNGGGVIFAGEGDAASTDTVVEQNVITDSYMRPGISSWWGGAVGVRNVARNNCVIRNVIAQVDLSGGGYASTGNVIADPGFRNAAAGDYRLAADSPCLTVVGYDTAAKLAGMPLPTPTPTATASPSATASASPAPTASATPTTIATASPTPAATTTAVPTPTSTPTATPSAIPTSPPPSATPTPTPTPLSVSTPAPPTATPPSAAEGTQPQTDPDQDPIEGAKLFIDDAAFSASGGFPAEPAAQCRPRRSPRCR